MSSDTQGTPEPATRHPSQGGPGAPWKELKPEDQMDLLGGTTMPRDLSTRMQSNALKVKSGPPILKALRKETGLGLKLLARVERLHKGDPLRQVDEFFSNFTIPAATGSKRAVGIKTELIYVEQMNVMVKDLKKLNMGIQNLSEFSTSHVRALTQGANDAASCAATETAANH